MKTTDLNEDQVRDVEERLEEYDGRFIREKLTGDIRIGIEEDGRLIAGLDASVTAFRILYVSTVFVEEAYRRKGIGTALIREMERRAALMGVDTIRLDTFSWQGKEFYEAMGYRIVGNYENSAGGYAEYFFLKRLSPPDD